MMIGIFYGSTTGSTETIAQEIAKHLNVAVSDIHNVANTQIEEIAPYDLLLLGSSTWGCGELQDDWLGFLDILKTKDLSNKTVGLFGCGDSASYPDTFCDAVGLLYKKLQETGCKFVGIYRPEGYNTTDSLISIEGQFVGLAIDESEPEKTKERIAAWCRQIQTEE